MNDLPVGWLNELTLTGQLLQAGRAAQRGLLNLSLDLGGPDRGGQRLLTLLDGRSPRRRVPFAACSACNNWGSVNPPSARPPKVIWFKVRPAKWSRRSRTRSQSVAASDTNFCVSCHAYAAVKIDCFECHATKPQAGGTDLHQHRPLHGCGLRSGSRRGGWPAWPSARA